MEENALSLIQSWINSSANKVQVIPRVDFADKCETVLGISEHSSLGTIVNHTGGLSVADGLIRHLGGTNQYDLSIKDVNVVVDQKPTQIPMILVVANDIYGGLFGINTGMKIGKIGNVFYLPPDTYTWENLGVGHTAFLQWSINGNVKLFYEKYSCLQIPQNIPYNKVVSFNPPLWSADITKTNFITTQIDVKKMHAIRFGVLRQLP